VASKEETSNLTDGWHPARLIPTVGLRGEEEKERRASSCLLAVMHAVPEFGHDLLKELGAPKSPTIETFTEVRFKDRDGKTQIPDGAIVCERAGKRWTCLVEVKTGKAEVHASQVNCYLDIAKDNDFDGVLTISNQITASSSDSPVDVDGRKLKRTGLWHFSWWRIITEAIVQSRYRGVSDPDQAWILGELIAYFDSEASGTGGFEDMGERWVSVRTAAHDGTLRAGDEDARVVAERWDEFTQYLSLGLSQDLGRSVTLPHPRKQTRQGRLEELAKMLAADGMLGATLRVPDAIGDLELCCDLRARQTLTGVTVKAPAEGRARARVNWLLRQLGDAPDDLRIEAAYPNARETTGALLGQVREDPDCLRYPAEPRREARGFTITLSRPMGKKRGKAEGSFVRETRTQTYSFYRDLIQNLKPWQPKAPKLREEPAEDPESSAERPSPNPPPVTAPESRDPGEAPDPYARAEDSAAAREPGSGAYSPGG
jgi:hypothetical protein